MRYEFKQELALAYFPYVSKNSACKLLAKQIEETPGLKRQLELIGYRKQQKRLTPRQVQVIMEYLGEP